MKKTIIVSVLTIFSTIAGYVMMNLSAWYGASFLLISYLLSPATPLYWKLASFFPQYTGLSDNPTLFHQFVSSVVIFSLLLINFAWVYFVVSIFRKGLKSSFVPGGLKRNFLITIFVWVIGSVGMFFGKGLIIFLILWEPLLMILRSFSFNHTFYRGIVFMVISFVWTFLLVNVVSYFIRKIINSKRRNIDTAMPVQDR